jgi:hypothetical protein
LLVSSWSHGYIVVMIRLRLCLRQYHGGHRRRQGIAKTRR